MNRREVDDAVSVANPVDSADGSPLTSSEHEFVAGVVAEPQETGGRPRRPRRGPAAMAMTLGAIGVGALAFLFLGNGGSGPAGPPASAYAAELARISEDGSKEVVVVDPGTDVVVEPGTEIGWTGSEVVITQPPEDSYLKPAPGGTGKSDDGWTVTAAVWDCTDLPCVRKSIDEAQRTGLIPGGEKWRKLPGDTELVVPPSGD